MIFLLGSSSDLCPVEGIIKEVICHALFSVYTWCEQRSRGGTVFEDHSSKAERGRLKADRAKRLLIFFRKLAVFWSRFLDYDG